MHHHAWPTHWPLLWGGLCLAALPGLCWPALRAHACLLGVFAGSGLLHQVLDTLVGDIRWRAPFDPQPTSLFVVQRIYEPWWLNFFLHPTFLVEIALIVAAIVTWRRAHSTPGALGAG